MNQQIGFLGLGKMGSRMAGKLARGGHTVSVWNRSPERAEELVKNVPSVHSYPSIEELVKAMPAPRVLWCMVPAGEPTESLITTVLPLLSSGDMLIDGGNARFSDTERRAAMCAEKSVRFLGIGVSGGIIAETEGYPIMVGGDRSAYDEIVPLLDTLATPHGGHTYFGTGGAGHFVKMVHNGIEYGIMQSLAEGFAVLKNSSYQFDLAQVASLWQKGTLVSGFLLDRTSEVLKEDQNLHPVVGTVAQSGEATWTIEEAKKENVAVPVMEASLAYRIASQSDPEIQLSFTAKLLSAMRKAFGGHAVESKKE